MIIVAGDKAMHCYYVQNVMIFNCEIHFPGHGVEFFVRRVIAVCYPLTILASFCKLYGKLSIGSMELNMCFVLGNL